MLALRSYEKKNKDGFAAMTADELKFINGGGGCYKGKDRLVRPTGPNKKK